MSGVSAGAGVGFAGVASNRAHFDADSNAVGGPDVSVTDIGGGPQPQPGDFISSDFRAADFKTIGDLLP